MLAHSESNVMCIERKHSHLCTETKKLSTNYYKGKNVKRPSSEIKKNPTYLLQVYIPGPKKRTFILPTSIHL